MSANFHYNGEVAAPGAWAGYGPAVPEFVDQDVANLDVAGAAAGETDCIDPQLLALPSAPETGYVGNDDKGIDDVNANPDFTRANGGDGFVRDMLQHFLRNNSVAVGTPPGNNLVPALVDAPPAPLAAAAAPAPQAAANLVATATDQVVNTFQEAVALVEDCKSGQRQWTARALAASERAIGEVPGCTYVYRKAFNGGRGQQWRRWTDQTKWGPSRDLKCPKGQTASQYHEVLVKHESARRGQAQQQAPRYRAHGLLKKVFNIVELKNQVEYGVVSYQRPDMPPPDRDMPPAPPARLPKDDADARHQKKLSFRTRKEVVKPPAGYTNPLLKGMAAGYKEEYYRPLCVRDCGSALENVHDAMCLQGHMQ